MIINLNMKDIIIDNMNFQILKKKKIPKSGELVWQICLKGLNLTLDGRHHSGMER